jgi:predicted glycosyltransferase
VIAIYAAGGGRGHLARARQIAARFRDARIYGDGELPDGGDTIIVDTFAGGRRGELADVLPRFARRVLVRRYVRPGSDVHDAIDAYDRVWLPYAADACEWDGAVPGEYVGPLVRTLRVAGPVLPLVVLGDVARLPADWAWPAGTTFVARWDDVLPAARAYFVVGAGHNTIYELRGLGVPFAAYPLDRRFDDQHRRAARLGVGVWSKRELGAWLC